MSSFVMQQSVTKSEFYEYAEEQVVTPIRKCMGLEFPLTKCYERVYMEFGNSEDKQRTHFPTDQFVSFHVILRDCKGIHHIADARVIIESNTIELRNSFADSWKTKDSVLAEICKKNQPKLLE